MQRIGIDSVWPVKVIAHVPATRRRLAASRDYAACSGCTRSVFPSRRRRCCWAAALIATLLFGLVGVSAVAATAGSHLRLLANGVRGFVSDGTRYAAWELPRLPGENSTITIFDSRNGRRRRVEPPAGCTLRRLLYAEGLELRRQGAAGRFLLNCQRPGFPLGESAAGHALLDAATGRITRLPEGSTDDSWRAVGSLYLEGTADAEACSHSPAELQQAELRQSPPSCVALYELSTGALSYSPEDSPRGELDRSEAPPICPKFRLAAAAERTEEKEEDAYSDGLYVHAAPHGHGSVIIEGCTGKPITLKGRGTPRDFDVRGGLLTWDTGHRGAELEYDPPNEGPGTLFSYDLATRKRRSWRLPKLTVLTEAEEGTPPIHGVYGYATHTRSLVFWVAIHHREQVCTSPGPCGGGGGPEVFSVYAARL